MLLAAEAAQEIYLRALIGVVLAVLRDLIGIGFRTRAEIIAENLFLRRQLALYQERKTRRRRPTAFAKLALVVLSKFFSWAPALPSCNLAYSFAGTEPDSDCSGGGNRDPSDGHRYPRNYKR